MQSSYTYHPRYRDISESQLDQRPLRMQAFPNAKHCISPPHSTLLPTMPRKRGSSPSVILAVQPQHGLERRGASGHLIGEYTGTELAKYLSDKGISHEITTPDMPRHNGAAELMNQTLSLIKSGPCSLTLTCQSPTGMTPWSMRPSYTTLRLRGPSEMSPLRKLGAATSRTSHASVYSVLEPSFISWMCNAPSWPLNL
jgi:hypothetical protein